MLGYLRDQLNTIHTTERNTITNPFEFHSTDEVWRRRVCYAEWQNKNDANPINYTNPTCELFNLFRQHGCLFARKFPKNSITLDMWKSLLSQVIPLSQYSNYQKHNHQNTTTTSTTVRNNIVSSNNNDSSGLNEEKEETQIINETDKRKFDTYQNDHIESKSTNNDNNIDSENSISVDNNLQQNQQPHENIEYQQEEEEKGDEQVLKKLKKDEESSIVFNISDDR